MCTVDLEEDEEQTETDAEAGEMILGEGHRGCLSCDRNVQTMFKTKFVLRVVLGDRVLLKEQAPI